MTLTPERWQQVRHVLHEAMQMDEAERPAFLDSQCASDPSLRAELNDLLAAEGAIHSSFLEKPAIGQTQSVSATGGTVLPSGTKLGPYVVQSLIGAGGMGEVYRARDGALKRDVAIKVLPTSCSRDPDRLRRFQLEAEAAAALNHPNILSIYHIGQQDGAPYIVTELLEGETLRERLRQGALRPRDAIDIAIQVAKGLAAAHGKRIAHRDLKPENLFLVQDGRVKILDFGLAKLMQLEVAEGPNLLWKNQTDAGRILGTVGYMSPEQVRGQPADARSDIFSAGAVLYEMLTGQRAFHRATSAETMSAILNEDPPALSQIVTDLPPGLQRVVNHCLTKNPEQRFQHASDVAFALEALSDSSGGMGGDSSAAVRSRSGSAMGLRLKWLTAAVLLFGLALELGWRYLNHRPREFGEIRQRQLTARAGDNVIESAVISRDGKYLAYADKDGISIQEIEREEAHRLPGSAGTKAWDWYPDGLRLLVTDQKNELSVFFAVTGEKRKMATGVFDPSLSPDGAEIVFIREYPDSHEIWTMPTTTGEAKVRLAIGKDEHLLAVAWSPDGKSIAYIQRKDKDEAGILKTTNLENGETRTLLTDGALIGRGTNYVSWLPGGRIVFGLYKSSYTQSDLWGLTLDSRGSAVGKPFRLTNTTGLGVAGLSATSDGKRLAVLFARESYSLFVADLNKIGGKLEHPRRLTNDYWNYFPDCWTADSQTLFYELQVPDSGQGQIKSSIYKRKIFSDSADVILTGPESYAAWSISPDGAWVIATANRFVPGKGRLLRIPASGGTPEKILDLAGGNAQVHCATLGSRICILSEDVGKQQIFSMLDPVRGRSAEVARIDYTSDYQTWSLSSDGRRIALVDNMSDSVRVFDLQSKQLQVIHPVPSQKGLQTLAWSADGKRLFVSADTENGDMLFEMDLSGHTHMLLKSPPGWIGYPRPSPDGKRIAYTYDIGESNVTLLEHF